MPNNDNMPMINLNEVSKVYTTSSDQVRAVDQLSLQVNSGEFVAVLGSSGSGKSTLLSLIGGLTSPDRGEVTVADVRLDQETSAGLAAFRAREIGFVFQMFHLLPYLHVLDNVRMAATSPTEVERAEPLLIELGLKDRLTHLPGQLSAGERQRTAIARALLNRPRLLLADEPTGNLDPQSAAAVMEHLAEFHRQGGTVVLVTHDTQAASYSDRQITLAQGKLQVDDSPACSGS